MTAGLLAATSRGSGDESPLRIRDLPSRQEAIALLESHHLELIRKHFGILRPEGLDSMAYREALHKALLRESPSPPPRRRRRTTRRQVAHAEKTLRALQEVEEEVAAQLFVAGALLQIAGDEGVNREFLAREIVRSGRKRNARWKARGLKG